MLVPAKPSGAGAARSRSAMPLACRIAALPACFHAPHVTGLPSRKKQLRSASRCAESHRSQRPAAVESSLAAFFLAGDSAPDEPPPRMNTPSALTSGPVGGTRAPAAQAGTEAPQLHARLAALAEAGEEATRALLECVRALVEAGADSTLVGVPLVREQAERGWFVTILGAANARELPGIAALLQALAGFLLYREERRAGSELERVV